jgi:TP901 family phage tail tape measure protein
VAAVSEIDDLYVILRAQYAPMVEGFTATTAAGEEMATSVVAACTEITAQVERMSLAVRTELGQFDAAATASRYEIDRLAKATTAASIEMEAAIGRATTANAALAASLAATPARTGPSAKALGLVAVATAAIGYESVKSAANFESATVRLVTSAGEIQENLDMVRKGILQMAGQVGDSAADLARAMYVIESGGQHGADGLMVLRAAAEGAKAENADLAVVADAVTSVLQDYHLKADQAATVTSKLVAAVGAGKTTFQELTGSLHSVLPIASSAGIALADVTGALASMTVHGMSADQAAQNLADTIKHMVAPTQVQTKELGQLGVSSADLADMLGKKGITGTLQYLSETILQHMGPSGRVMLNAFNQSKDAAHDANVMIAAMPPNLQALAHQFQNGTITLGEWRKQLKGMPPEQANLLQQFASLQARASGFNDILKSGSPAAQTYQDALRRVTGDATGLNVALMLTGENTDYVNSAVSKVAGTTTEAGNHVKGWGEIQGTFNQKMSEAKDGLKALGTEIGEALLPVVSKLADGLKATAEWLGKHPAIAKALAVALGVLTVAFTVATVAVWAMNSALLANPITWIIMAFVVAIAIMVYAIWYMVTNFKQAWHNVVGLAEWAWHKIVGAWHGIAHEAKHIWNDDIVAPIKRAWHGIKQGFDDAVDWCKALPGRIGHALSALPGKLEHAAKEGVHRFAYNIGYGLGRALVFFKELPGKVWHAITSMWDGAIHIVSKGVKDFLHWIKDMADRAVANVEQWWKDMVDRVDRGFKKIGKWFEDLPHNVNKWLNDTKDKAVAKVTEWWTEMLDRIDRGFKKIGEWFDDLPHKIKEAVKDAGQWLWDAGKHVVQGLLDGIKSMWKGAMDFVKGIGHDLAQGFKDAVGIHSPSTVFAEAGRNIVAGLVAGVEGSRHQAVAAVNSLLRGASMPTSIGLSVAGGGGLSLAGGGLAGGTPAPSGGGQPIVVQVDGKKLFQIMVPQAQRFGIRNTSTFLTRA